MFFKECKKILFSITFIIYLVASVGMFATQYGEDSGSVIPEPTAQGPRGMTVVENPEQIMRCATQGLFYEYMENSYITYPVGFYKVVKLTEKKQEMIADLLFEITGPIEGNFEESALEITPSPTMTYERFREIMEEVDDILGGGSMYGESFLLESFSYTEMTFEQDLANYNALIYDDKVSNGYARLFCDYVGIVASLLPVFVAVGFCLKDKRSRVTDLVYSRKISSVKIIATRFLALCLMCFAPIFITAIIAQGNVETLYVGFEIDHFAFVKYSLTWLLPNVLAAVSVGMLLTELTGSPIAIAVQFVWWFASIMKTSLSADFSKFQLIIRHNNILNRAAFNEEAFLFNRAFFVVLSLVLLVATMYVYERKRRGKINANGLLSKNSASKSEA